MTDEPNAPERFSSGLELDTSALDDPAATLQQALAAGQQEKAVGAFRLLATTGQEVRLGQEQARLLGGWLEQSSMALEAARVYRKGAESDLGHPDAPEMIFRSACLLLGPACRPGPGADMLMYLVGNFPQHGRRPDAEEVLRFHEAGDAAGLAEVLARHGVEVHNLAAPARPVLRAPAIEPPPRPAGGRIADKLAGRIDPALARRLTQIAVIAFLVALGVFLVSRYARKGFKGVDDIRPEVLAQPVQADLPAGEGDSLERVVRITHNGYNMALHPVADYRLSGLVVSKNDYRMLGLSRGEFFLMDLCVLWGETVRRGAHRQPALEIVQAGTVCYFSWRGPALPIAGNELSNNHIFVTDPDLESRFESVEPGDQITIEGELVNVTAVPVEAQSFAQTAPIRIQTSTTRDDQGMGACEIIFAKGLEILARGHPLARIGYAVSLWALILLGLLLVARVILIPVGRAR